MDEQVDAVLDGNDITCPCGTRIWTTESEFRLPNTHGTPVLLVRCTECKGIVRTPEHPEWRNQSRQFVEIIRDRRLRREAREFDDEMNDDEENC